MPDIGTTLKRWRIARGLTQKQVGKAVGVSQFTIASYELGVNRPPREKLERIAALYSLTVEALTTEPLLLTPELEAALGKYKRAKKPEPETVKLRKPEHVTIPTVPEPETDTDGLYESAAMRIKAAVCKGCQARGRGCDTCRLERYVRLCIDVVNGVVNMGDGLHRAGTLIEDCIADANARHDRETGFMQRGHVGPSTLMESYKNICTQKRLTDDDMRHER